MKNKVMILALVLAACEPPPSAPPPAARVPVTSEVLSAGPFQASVTVLGRVEPAVRLELRAPAGGRIRYPPRFAGGLRTGETVGRGELLFAIDNDQLGLRLAEAELAAQGANAELERARGGVAGGFLPAAELKRSEIAAELAAKRLDNARLQVGRLSRRAPVGGVLEVDDTLAPGSEIRGERLVARIAGGGRPRVEAWAAAAAAERLEPDLAVEYRLPEGTVVGRGTLSEVSRRVDDDGTVRLVAAVEEDLGLPTAGDGIELRVLLAPKSDALSLPVAALIVEGGVASAFVLEPSGTEYRARRRRLRTGGRDRGRIEVLAGLRDGERVAVRGAELLADGLTAVEAEEAAER